MYDSQTQSYMFRMREAVIHFAPTTVPDARSRYTFRANTLPSTERNIPCNLDIPQEQSTSFPWTSVYILHLKRMEHSTVYNLNLKRTVVYSLQFQPQRNSPILGQPRRYIYSIFYINICCHLPFFWAVAIALFVIRFTNVVRVNGHLCSYYTVIFLNIQLQILPFFKPKISVTCILYFKQYLFFGKLN